MADQGPATNNGEQIFTCPAPNAQSYVALEIHTQNNVSTPASSGVPGGLAGTCGPNGVGNNNLGPGDFAGVGDASAYGTVPSGSVVTPVFFNQTLANPAGGASAINLFRLKNPG